MALLPHERQAERARRIAWAAVTALVLLAVGGVLLHPYFFIESGQDGRKPPRRAEAEQAPSPGTHSAMQAATTASLPAGDSPLAAPPPGSTLASNQASNPTLVGSDQAPANLSVPGAGTKPAGELDTIVGAASGSPTPPTSAGGTSAVHTGEKGEDAGVGGSSGTVLATLTPGPNPHALPVTSNAAIAEADSHAEALTGTPNSRANGRDGTPRAATQSGTRVLPFGKALGFQNALLNAGLSLSDSGALVAALDSLMDFRRCRPEDQLSVTYDAHGVPQAFEYRASQTERYRARRVGQDFEAERVQVTVTTQRLVRGGHIDVSLGQALEQIALGTSLVGAFVEAFEREIDFQRDTRTGDRFRLVVEQRFIDGEPVGYGAVHALEYQGARVGTLRAYWFEPRDGRAEFFDGDGRARVGGWLRTPLRYDFISSGFDPHRRHPILKRIMPHNGVDYVAATGTPVWAAADGVVSFAGAKGPNGNLVSLRHADGYETHYAHLSRIQRGVRRGQRVTQRSVIGAVGTTGRSTGPHLHFGLEHRSRFIDPLSKLNGPGKPLSKRELGEFKRLRAELDAELAAVPLAPAPSEVAHTGADGTAFLPVGGPVEL